MRGNTLGFLNNQHSELPSPSSLSELAAEMLTPLKEDYSTSPALWTKKVCECCQTTAIGEEAWERHIKGRRHRNRVKKRNKNITNLARKLQSDNEDDNQVYELEYRAQN
jgi:hypothetical protein